MKLGARVKAARKGRSLGLVDVTEALREVGEDLNPGTLTRMEDGSRPGEPRVWGKLWRLFGLPLHELYEGLDLPIPDGEPSGVKAEIIAAVDSMTEETQRVVLGFARHAPAIIVAAGLREPTALTTSEPNIDRLSTDTPPEDTYAEKGARAPWTRAAEERRGYSPTEKKRS